MSEVKNEADRLAVVSAFLKERGVTLTCWSCGGDKWRLVDNKADEAVVPMMAVGEQRLTSAIHTDALICLHCGFLRLHVRRVVDGEEL